MFTASLHGILFFFDFFWKYQLYSKGGQCLIPKSLFVVTVSSTDSSFKLTFFVRSYVCWNYILVAPFDGEREKGGGRRKGGNKLMLGLYHDCVKDWVGQIHNSLYQTKKTQKKWEKNKENRIGQHIYKCFLWQRLLKFSDEKLEFWRPGIWA